jgi:hypothetical protein
MTFPVRIYVSYKNNILWGDHLCPTSVPLVFKKKINKMDWYTETARHLIKEPFGMSDLKEGAEGAPGMDATSRRVKKKRTAILR